MEGNEDYHVAEPHVEAAESSDVQSKNEVEVLPPSQPDGGQAASKAWMSASKAVRRRAAQKARKRRGK
jgi:hypothetical protein